MCCSPTNVNLIHAVNQIEFSAKFTEIRQIHQPESMEFIIYMLKPTAKHAEHSTFLRLIVYLLPTCFAFYNTKPIWSSKFNRNRRWTLKYTQQNTIQLTLQTKKKKKHSCVISFPHSIIYICSQVCIRFHLGTWTHLSSSWFDLNALIILAQSTHAHICIPALSTPTLRFFCLPKRKRTNSLHEFMHSSCAHEFTNSPILNCAWILNGKMVNRAQNGSTKSFLFSLLWCGCHCEYTRNRR